MEAKASIESKNAATPASGYDDAVAVEAGRDEGKGVSLTVEGFMDALVLGPASPAVSTS